MSQSIHFDPGYTANPEQVFVVTGFLPDEKDPKKTELASPQAHYVIGHNSFAATRVVLNKFPAFVPMGCTNLKELKKMVVAMEAVRAGVLRPLGVSDSAIV